MIPYCEVTAIGKQLRKHGFTSLEEYLESDRWKRVRERKYSQTTKRRRENYRCFCCNRRVPLSLHHLTYERLCEENLKDLEWVCKECHTKIHEHKTLVNPIFAKKRLKIATKSVRRANIRQGLWAYSG